MKDFGVNYLNQRKQGGNKNIPPINFNVNDSYYLLDDLLVFIKIKDNIQTKYLFDSSGIHITTVTDRITNNQNFTRKMGNVTLVIQNSVVVDYRVEVDLPIIKPSVNKLMDISNPMFGVIDLETYPSNDGYNKVYAAGFYTKDKLSMFYINENDLNSEKVTLDCIDSMLQPKYNKYVFYAHNLSGYDGVFILKSLVDFNIKSGSIIYDIDITFRDGRIMSMLIGKKAISTDKNGKKGKNVKIRLLDSFLMLSNSLSKLGQAYDVEVVKGIFPHEFAKATTLFYKGVTPDKKYFKGVKDEDYIKLVIDDWDFKDECLKYLKDDLITLFLIMDKFKKNIHRNFGVEVLNSPTISRLAYDIYMENYYKNNIPLISKLDIWSFIKEAFFGGMSEVYKPYGNDLYYYDVNSLYPFAALNLMPGTPSEFQDFLNKNPDLKTLFGYYYAEVESENNYLGLLPWRSKSGAVILPNGKWTGIYISEELKFAKENGFKINVKYGYTFNKIPNLFDGYIKDIYKTKVESVDKVNRNISKSLLNNFIGRWGMNITKPTTSILNDVMLEEISKTRVVVNTIPISENSNLTTYYTDVSKELCEEFGVNYISALEKKLDIKSLSKSQKFTNVNISITAAVNSYARIYMGKVKLDLIRKGYTLYYTDTDSLVVNKPIDESLVGPKLGQFKLEHRIKRGYFISSKLYCLVTYDKDSGNSLITKSKGADSSSLTEVDFVGLLHKTNIELIKTQSHILYDKGSVNITNSSVTFDADAYKNRLKIYNDDGVWVDTRPHYIYTDLSLILYKAPIGKVIILYKPAPMFLIKCGSGYNTDVYNIKVVYYILSIIFCTYILFYV